LKYHQRSLEFQDVLQTSRKFLTYQSDFIKNAFN
jgi:hypothetical protein